MSTFECPPEHICKISVKPIEHVHGWYANSGLQTMTFFIIFIVLGFIIIIAIIRDDRRKREERLQAEREERKHKLHVEEQRTMQLDACQGSPELLRAVRELQRMGR